MGRPSKEEQIKQIPRRLLYTTNEAAKLLCCGRPFLLEELKNGNLGYIRRGRLWLIPAAALDKYIEERTQLGCTS